MVFLMKWLRRNRYAPVIKDDCDCDEADTVVALPASRCKNTRSELRYLMALILIIMTTGVAGFLMGIAMSGQSLGSYKLARSAPQGQFHPSPRSHYSDSKVHIGHLSKTFVYNETFAAIPSTTVTREPIWDSLLPSELESDPSRSLLSLLQQMAWATSKIQRSHQTYPS